MPARIALALLLLLSVPSTLMGMPLPSAVRALAAQRGAVVRGWVVNGYCSVLGSCVAMRLSIGLGFHAVLLCGAALYALAALLFSR